MVGRGRFWMVASLLLALVAAGCGDDDGVSVTGGNDSGAVSEEASAGDDTADVSTNDTGASAGAGAGDAGTLVLDGETIAFDLARCFLQEQDAAAGGGKILFVAQAFGVNAAGDEISIDVTRWDEDSQFTGDDIIVDIGDPFSEDAVSLNASTDLGTVTVAGSEVSASNLTFNDFDDFSEHSGSFEINC